MLKVIDKGQIDKKKDDDDDLIGWKYNISGAKMMEEKSGGVNSLIYYCN